MRKTATSLTLIAILAVFSVSAIFCCCVGKTVRSLSFNKSSAHACCPESKAAPQKDTKPCACSSISKYPVDVPPVMTLASAALDGFQQVAEVVISGHEVQLTFNRLAYGGEPPGDASVFPLYLANRSLRL